MNSIRLNSTFAGTEPIVKLMEVNDVAGSVGLKVKNVDARKIGDKVREEIYADNDRTSNEIRVIAGRGGGQGGRGRDGGRHVPKTRSVAVVDREMATKAIGLLKTNGESL